MDDLDARKREILTRLNAKIKATRAFNRDASSKGPLSSKSNSEFSPFKGAKTGEQYIKEMRMRLNENSSNTNKTSSKFHALMEDDSISSSQNSVASSLRIRSDGRVRDFLAQKRHVDSKTVYKKPWIGGSEIGRSSKTDQARSSLTSISSLNVPKKPNPTQTKLSGPSIIKSILKPSRPFEISSRAPRALSRKSNVSEASTSKSSRKSFLSRSQNSSKHSQSESNSSESNSPEPKSPPTSTKDEPANRWNIFSKKPKPLEMQRESIKSAPSKTCSKSKPLNPSNTSDISKCKYCSRPFNNDRLEKHQSICLKTEKSKKTRGKFDSKQMRTQGTEISSKRSKSAPSQAPSQFKSKSNWRKNHQDFMDSLRQAKAISAHIAKGGKASDIPTVTTKNDGKSCPHCSRKFGES